MDTATRKTILIVDDEPAIVELLTVLLSSHGYKTKIASTGHQAMQYAGRTDLILLDMVLPDAEGLKVCRELKSQSHTKDIPIIIISGQPTKPGRIESLYLGADDYIVKPFEPDELFARMDVALRRHHFHDDEQNHVEHISELQRIIDEESISLRFQPIYFLKPMRLLGFEMLSRPQSHGQMANPEVFFKAALKYGVYYEVEMIGWRKAIKMASEIFDGKQKLFLNCDPYLIESDKFTSVKSVFARHGLTNQEVFLEVTERSAVMAFDAFYRRLRQYREDGFKIAVDDLGAGYSSLESIVEIHPEAVKLDKRLVNGLSTDRYKNSIVKLFVSFCRENGIICIAEGIENREDFEALLELGVDAGQGYYLCRPTDIIDLSNIPAFD